MTLLIDIGAVPEGHCNDCLEDLFKAIAEDPDGDDASIWAPVPNPWIRDHVEEVTRRFQAILVELQNALSRALFGQPATELAKADVPWRRWAPGEFEEVRFALEHKATVDYTLDDWLLLCEWLIARYLPDGVIQSEADYLTVRAALLGKLQATMEEQSTHTAELRDLVSLVPTSFRAVPPRVLRPIEASILRVAKERAAVNIGRVTDSARSRMKDIVIEHVQAGLLGQGAGTPQALRQRLFDTFGILNRDFRKIAVTEAGECCNQGVVAAMPDGQALKRREAYKGACEFCRSINGKVFQVVSPTDPNRDGQTDVWLGKTNIGRSAALRKREGSRLVERPPEELWWPAAGVQHPHCRGAWLPVSTDKPPEVSQEYADWLQGLIAAAQANAKPAT